MSSFRSSRKPGYENEHGVGKGAEDGEEQASDDTGAENLEQELAAIGEVGGGRVHQVAVYQNQEQVPDHGGGAGQEPIGLVAGGVRCREGVVESEVGREGVRPVVDSIGDKTGRRGVDEVGEEHTASVGLAAEDQEEEEE